MTGKSRNQPGLQKGLYIQDALKPSGITYDFKSIGKMSLWQLLNSCFSTKATIDNI